MAQRAALSSIHATGASVRNSRRLCAAGIHVLIGPYQTTGQAGGHDLALQILGSLIELYSQACRNPNFQSRCKFVGETFERLKIRERSNRCGRAGKDSGKKQRAIRKRSAAQSAVFRAARRRYSSLCPNTLPGGYDWPARRWRRDVVSVRSA